MSRMKLHNNNHKSFLKSMLVMLAMATTASAADKLTVEDMTIKQGETKDITFTFTTQNTVAQAQFMLSLPDGLVPTSREVIVSDHVVSLTQKGSKYAITVLSDSNASLTGSVTVKVVANSTVDGTIDASNIKCATGGVQVTGFTLADSQARVTAPTEPTKPEGLFSESSINVKAGSVFQLPLYLTAEKATGVISANIQLPEGFTFNGINLSDEVDSKGLTVATNVLANGSVQMLVSSPEAGLIPAGEKMNIGCCAVKAASKVADDSKVVIGEIMVVDANANGAIHDTVAVAISCDDDDIQTGIDALGADADGMVKVYDVSGKYLGVKNVNDLGKGVYLINGKKVTK